MKSPVTVLIVGVLIISSGALGADSNPPSKAQVLGPQADQLLSGQVEVRVKLPEKLSGPVYAGLGGRPWVKLEKAADGDDWVGTTDTRMVPNGDETLIIKTMRKQADTAIAVKVKNPLKVYFADLHSHTGYSDGHLIPAVAHDYARNTAKLDVFSLTDHLEYVDDNEWLDMRETAWKANEDGRFVAIPGLEWTKREGHMNIFDPKTNRWPADVAGLYEAAAKAGVTCKFNHPGNGANVFGGLAYSEIGDKAVQLMEVRRGEEEKAYIRALKLGWHIAPDGSDDTHTPNWGIGFAWSGILAPGLSQRNILDALANRRCYSTLDRNCILRFRINGEEMGTIIEHPAKEVRAAITVTEPDASDLIVKIELFEDGVVLQTDEPNSYRRNWRTSFDAKAGKHFYFVKVTQVDGNMMWSAPIWLTVGE